MREMDVAFVVGTRPHFVKFAALRAAMGPPGAGPGLRPRLIHTGQHYDESLSQRFFTEFGLGPPEVNISAGSGSHGVQTARMLVGLEEALGAMRPRCVVVFGDTNSTMAGALSAKKLGLPLLHVEAGLRNFDLRNAEELNRVIVDHISDALLCSTPSTLAHCRSEGLGGKATLVGDVTFDFFLAHRERMVRLAERSRAAGRAPGSYYVATVHRAEAAGSRARLESIFAGLGRLALPVLCPLHPRTRAALADLGVELPPNVRTLEPAGYFELGALIGDSRGVVTDSSGLQREAYFWRKPCVVVREHREWLETIESGWAAVVGWAGEGILPAMEAMVSSRPAEAGADFFGQGDAGAKIVREILKFAPGGAGAGLRTPGP